MNLPYPQQAVQSVQPPKGMEPGRFSNRYKHFKKLLDQNPNREQISDFQGESMIRSMEAAHRLLQSDEKHAFDLTREPKDSASKYGDSRFGQCCLLARRLVEQGSRFVEVTTEYVPFLNWDTHENGHTTATRMKKEIDQPVAQLILDLEARGMLDRTLVILASEFSRDMMIEGVPGSTAPDQSLARTDNFYFNGDQSKNRIRGGKTTVLRHEGWDWEMRPGSARLRRLYQGRTPARISAKPNHRVRVR